MAPRDYQIVGSYLDVALLLVVGLVGLFIPAKLIGTNGTEDERKKRIKILKVCGGCMLVGSIIKLLLKVT